jgi:hypothetical protein
MDFGKPPYFSGKTPSPPMILDRYLPPYPGGSLLDMLEFSGINNGWVLDPIGNQPLSAIELAQAGYKVFVACNNPIVARIMGVICAAHPKSVFQAAIADLGALKRGEERLENQIKNLYHSPCPTCLSLNTNVRYLWKKNQTLPFAREVTCHDCDFTGITKISDDDEDNLKKIGNIQLHRSRLLQRVLPGTSTPPIAIKEVIDSYLPRSIAVISSLVNKLESINISKDKKEIIEALLIQVFDSGNMLWGIPSGRARPKQITIPAEFYEFNLWNVIEDAISNLQILEKPIPFLQYPDIPPDSGGICFYAGRIQSISKKDDLPQFSAITTVLPRPNQAMWTYNAVWSGWLWGHQAAQRLKGALERRRYDWIWHSQAISKTFEYTASFNIPFLAIAPELTNSYILAYLTAASSSNFSLVNAAFHREQKLAQFYWSPAEYESSSRYLPQKNSNLKRYLELKSEPANYQELLSLFFIAETIDKNKALSLETFDNNLLINAQSLFDKHIMNKEEFIQVDEDQLENGDFWLTQDPPNYQPISDQTEKEFIRLIQKMEDFIFEDVAYKINLTQPGILPISFQQLQRLLNSYCEPQANAADMWKIKPKELIISRKNDVSEIRRMIIEIGEKMGYSISGENPIHWTSKQQDFYYQFFVTASSIVSQFQEKFEPENYEIVILFPGSRSDLLGYKLKNDPVYKRRFGKFHYVKYRHIRLIHENPGLNQQTWVKMLDSDPAVWQESSQPVLF